MDTRASYDSAAKAYAEHLAGELAHKPLDRHLLSRFAGGTGGRGLVAALGCGPGQVARYLHEQGVAAFGLDLSPGMVEVAVSLHPDLEFRVDDMTRPSLADASLAGLVSFYSIVHFEAAELGAVFQQMRRVLAPGGLAVVAYDIGVAVVHLDGLFGAPVSLEFRFHVSRNVVEALRRAHATGTEHTERAANDG